MRAQRGHRLLIGRTVVGRQGRVNRFEFDEHGTLSDALLLYCGGHSTSEELAPGRGDGGQRQFRVSRQCVGIMNGVVRADPVGFGHQKISLCFAAVKHRAPNSVD